MLLKCQCRCGRYRITRSLVPPNQPLTSPHPSAVFYWADDAVWFLRRAPIPTRPMPRSRAVLGSGTTFP